MKPGHRQLHVHIERLTLEDRLSGAELERRVQQQLAAEGLADGLGAQIAQAVRSQVDVQTTLAVASVGTMRRDRSER